MVIPGMNSKAISEASEIFWEMWMADQKEIHGNQAGIANCQHESA
jgi:hypothetical protein